uniref:Secreted protein n=1 Tax=Romanomermis culicivorax TaxID=13658 RepID=A0A915HY72_ROMCU
MFRRSHMKIIMALIACASLRQTAKAFPYVAPSPLTAAAPSYLPYYWVLGSTMPHIQSAGGRPAIWSPYFAPAPQEQQQQQRPIRLNVRTFDAIDAGGLNPFH